jgi:hypothetical protein
MLISRIGGFAMKRCGLLCLVMAGCLGDGTSDLFDDATVESVTNEAAPLTCDPSTRMLPDDAKGDCLQAFCSADGTVSHYHVYSDYPAAQGRCMTGLCSPDPVQRPVPAGVPCPGAGGTGLSVGICDGGGECAESTPDKILCSKELIAADSPYWNQFCSNLICGDGTWCNTGACQCP